MTDSLYIVGRGPSVHGFDWGMIDGPVMAVSSGIYALPLEHRPEHFATLDPPKYFIAGLVPDSEIAWQHDEDANHRPFWSDPDITKHVQIGHSRQGYYRNIPIDILDHVPEEFREHAKEAFAKEPHIVGYQPMWGDYPNLKTWEMGKHLPPNFSPDGPFGLEELCNSWFFAVQVAHRLGYRQLIFIGCDFRLPMYENLLKKVEVWHDLARECGFAWINYSPDSALSDIMTTVVGVTA